MSFSRHELTPEYREEGATVAYALPRQAHTMIKCSVNKEFSSRLLPGIVMALKAERIGNSYPREPWNEDFVYTLDIWDDWTRTQPDVLTLLRGKMFFQDRETRTYIPDRQQELFTYTEFPLPREIGVGNTRASVKLFEGRQVGNKHWCGVYLAFDGVVSETK